MNELPDGWESTTLGEIAAWGSGGTPSRSEPSYYGGGIPWIKTGELGPRFVSSTEESISEEGLSKSSAKLFRAGSVAIAMYGATIGKTSILGIPATTNQACAVGIPHIEVTTKEYLYHFLCSQKEAFVEAGKGGAQPNISQAIIKDWNLPLAPLPEQKRIADKLDSVLARVDACRDRLDRLPSLLKRFRQSILAAATSGQLTEDWRQSANYGYELPTGWASTTINEITVELRYGTSKKCDYEEIGKPVLRIPNMGEHGRLNLKDIKYAEFDIDEVRKLSLQAGDILIIRSNGSIDLVGKSCVVENEGVGQLFAGYLIRLRIEPSSALARYVYLCLTEPVQRQRIELISKSTSGVNNINSEEIRSLPLLLPPPSEQTEIVRRVELLFAFADRLEARLTSARRQVGQLTPSLLAKAFRGELVAQNPSDEPAAELLKRLAAQRETAPKAKRSRKIGNP